ncbi:MAG: hypothetical protein AAFN59_01330 [Pseudomonadota bacterium]
MRFHQVALTVLALAMASPLWAEDVTLEEGDLVLAAPSSITCETPPDFNLTGPALDALAGDRIAVNKLVSTMAGGLTQACSDIQSLTVRGTDRGVSFSFVITRDSDWMIDAPETIAVAAAPEPEPEPAPAQQPEPEPAPEPEAASELEIAEVTIEPGLSLEAFTSIFGPLPTFQGHVLLERNDTWARVLAARTYAENPGILSNDLDALDVAKMLMTPAEYQQFMGANAALNVQQISVFDRRDLANRVRTQLKPGLDQRRQTGPIKVYNIAQVRLGEYDFNTSSFPMDTRSLRNHQRPQWRTAYIQGAFDKFALPTRLSANVDQARQLDAYLRSRNDDRLWIAIFAEVNPVMPASLNQNAQYQRPSGTLTRVALYADQGLTQIVYDFTADLAAEQARIDQAFSILNEPIATGEDFVRAIGTILDSDAPANALAEAFAQGQNYGQGPTDVAERRNLALAAIGQKRGDTTLTFGGQVRFRAYDPVRKVLTIQQLRPQHQQLVSLPNVGFGVRNTFLPNLTEISVEPDVANAIIAAGGQNYMEMRLDAQMVQGSYQTPNGEYMEVQTTFRPARLTVFGGQQGGLPSDRRVLASIEIKAAAPAVPSLIEGLLIQD